MFFGRYFSTHGCRAGSRTGRFRNRFRHCSHPDCSFTASQSHLELPSPCPSPCSLLTRLQRQHLHCLPLNLQHSLCCLQRQGACLRLQDSSTATLASLNSQALRWMEGNSKGPRKQGKRVDLTTEESWEADNNDILCMLQWSMNTTVSLYFESESCNCKVPRSNSVGRCFAFAPSSTSLNAGSDEVFPFSVLQRVPLCPPCQPSCCSKYGLYVLLLRVCLQSPDHPARQPRVCRSRPHR